MCMNSNSMLAVMLPGKQLYSTAKSLSLLCLRDLAWLHGNQLHLLSAYHGAIRCCAAGSVSVLSHENRACLFSGNCRLSALSRVGELHKAAGMRSVHTSIGSCQKPQSKETESSQQVMEAKDKPYSEMSKGQKVVQAGKDLTYTGIVIGGIIVTGVMFYAIGQELFSGQSPSGIYGRALKLCRQDTQLIAACGEPIKGYGEMTRRGRRRYVSHHEYEKDGVKFMRMKFYVEGPFAKGTAHLEVIQDESSKYLFRYIFVDMDEVPPRTFIILDNR